MLSSMGHKCFTLAGDRSGKSVSVEKGLPSISEAPAENRASTGAHHLFVLFALISLVAMEAVCRS